MPESTNEAVREYVDEERPEAGGVWLPENEADLDWALKRICDLRAEIAENDRILEAHLARLELRRQTLNARLQRGVDFFESVAKSYAFVHRDRLLKGGKKKSRSLPHGTVGWRKAGGGLEVKDSKALLEWAKGQPPELGLVRTKEEPAMSEVQKLHKETGEVPPGTDVKPETEELYVKTLEVSDGSH
jgi:phage host-nuclease inhibitor protein Gam